MLIFILMTSVYGACTTDADCPSKTTEWGKTWASNRCSGDSRFVVQRGVETSYSCSNGNCVPKELNVEHNMTDCSAEKSFCYSEQKIQYVGCGCPVGYSSECQEAGRCVPSAVVPFGEACDCHVQCESGFCQNGICTNIGAVTLTSSKPDATVDEPVSVVLSVTNNLDREVDANLILNLGSNIIGTGATAQYCTGNRCVTTAKLDAKSTKEITMWIKGSAAGRSSLDCVVKYKFDGVEAEVTSSTEQQFIKCGDGICTSPETNSNCCLDCSCESGFSCNRATKACEKQNYPFFAAIGLVLVVVIAFLAKKK